jgi:hypothetical protein
MSGEAPVYHGNLPGIPTSRLLETWFIERELFVTDCGQTCCRVIHASAIGDPRNIDSEAISGDSPRAFAVVPDTEL